MGGPRPRRLRLRGLRLRGLRLRRLSLRGLRLRGLLGLRPLRRHGLQLRQLRLRLRRMACANCACARAYTELRARQRGLRLRGLSLRGLRTRGMRRRGPRPVVTCALAPHWRSRPAWRRAPHTAPGGRTGAAGLHPPMKASGEERRRGGLHVHCGSRRQPSQRWGGRHGTDCDEPTNFAAASVPTAAASGTTRGRQRTSFDRGGACRGCPGDPATRHAGVLPPAVHGQLEEKGAQGGIAAAERSGGDDPEAGGAEGAQAALLGLLAEELYQRANATPPRSLEPRNGSNGGRGRRGCQRQTRSKPARVTGLLGSEVPTTMQPVVYTAIWLYPRREPR